MTIMMLTVGGDVVRNHMINTVPRRPPGDAEPEDEAENIECTGELGPTRSTASGMSWSSGTGRLVQMWPRRVRLGYHIHDHRRVGATGMVVLLEPGVGPPSKGQVDDWAVSSCIGVGPRRTRAFRVRRICHWPCQGRVLVT